MSHKIKGGGVFKRYQIECKVWCLLRRKEPKVNSNKIELSFWEVCGFSGVEEGLEYCRINDITGENFCNLMEMEIYFQEVQ